MPHTRYMSNDKDRWVALSNKLIEQERALNVPREHPYDPYWYVEGPDVDNFDVSDYEYDREADRYERNWV